MAAPPQKNRGQGSAAQPKAGLKIPPKKSVSQAEDVKSEGPAGKEGGRGGCPPLFPRAKLQPRRKEKEKSRGGGDFRQRRQQRRPPSGSPPQLVVVVVAVSFSPHPSRPRRAERTIPGSERGGAPAAAAPSAAAGGHFNSSSLPLDGPAAAAATRGSLFPSARSRPAFPSPRPPPQPAPLRPASFPFLTQEPPSGTKQASSLSHRRDRNLTKN